MSHIIKSQDVKSGGRTAIRGALLAVAAFALLSPRILAQEAPSGAASAQAETAGTLRDLQEQVRELKAMVNEMHAENAQSRAEMRQLRRDLRETRAMLEQKSAPTENAAAGQAVQASQPAPANTANAAVSQTTRSIEDRVQKLEESTSLLGSKVDEQNQTKVETASKYHARLHGIVLMNAFRNVGSSNNLDFPNYAEPIAAGSSKATLGATLRQSEIGLEIFGPNVFGAKTSADVQMDFAGGFPVTGNGVNFGLVRLQTASMRLDWEHTSVIAGQDSLFISPLSPTSFASLATPAFVQSGNLWGWTPQLRVEKRFTISDRQNVTVQAGVLDNLDWEQNYNSFFRTVQAGEASGQPAFATRLAWSHPVHEHPLSFGVAGYYGRQNWSWNRYIDAWAGMADWQIPISSRLGLSGEFYRGRGIGGLGAAVGTSILYGGDPTQSNTPIRGLDTAGGWAQLKFQVTPKVELNGAVAEDNAFANDIRGFAIDANNGGPPGSILGRNRGALGNVIFRPRSDLIFSAELRRLHTFPVYTNSASTNQINFSMGILF